MDLNVKTVKLFTNEKELLISERTAGDVLSFSEFSGKIEDSNINHIYRAATMIEDGLKINFKKLKWYEVIKRLWYKRILNKKYLINNLTSQQISELAKEILILEGFKFDEAKVPDKKKVK